MTTPNPMLAIVGARHRRRTTSAGFTLIELVVTVTVVAILATIAYPSMAGLIAASRAKTAATEIYLALIKARSTALKFNQNATITSGSGGWQGGWQIAYGNSSPQTVIDNAPALSGVTVGTSAPTSVTYMTSGRINATARISFLVSAGSGSSLIQRCVAVDTGGRPAVTEIKTPSATATTC